MIGRQLGRYRIESRIGAGGMGEVYRGTDTRLGRPVAIKVLKPERALDPAHRKRLKREASALSRLSHPNIATVFDFNQDGDLDYLVMEYVEGESLGDLLKRERVSERDARDWGIQIAEALHEAHELGVLHRDIKPQNVMITRQHQAKMLDFGLAKLTHDESDPVAASTATVAGALVGTMPYLAPECLRGATPDERADVFGLGTLLYEVATGRRAFRADTAPLLVDQILHEDPSAVTALNPQIGPALQQVIEKCLDKDPARRYQTAQEVAVDLRRISLDESGEIPAHSSPAAPRSRWFRVALAGVPVAALVAWALIWFGSSEPALSFSARDWILVADFENQTDDKRYDAAIQTAFLTSLEQSQYANVYPRSRVAGVLKRMGRDDHPAIDEELGREICQRADVRGLVTASIGRIGQTFSLSARLIDPTTGERVRSYTGQANGEDEILETLETISKDLRRDLGESLASIHKHSAPLYAVTTASLDALRLYAQAIDAWDRIDTDLAMELLRQAIEIDADFAMAHAALGAHYYSHIFNNVEKGEFHYRRALELVDRVTDRERRIVETEFAAHRNHYDEARRLYRAYLTLYPDDLAMQQGFATLLMRNQLYAESAAAYGEVLRIEPDDAGANVNSGVCHTGLGNYREALAFYQRAFELQPTWRTWGNLNHEYGFLHVQVGDVAGARAVFREALVAWPEGHQPRRSLGILALYQGKLAEARSWFDEAIRYSSPDNLLLSRSRNHFFAFLTARWAGDDERAASELDLAVRDLVPQGPQPMFWMRIGIAQARGGEISAATETLTRMESQVDEENERHRSLLLRLRGEVELAKGNHVEGMELLYEALRVRDEPEIHQSIALAQAQFGSDEDAVVALEDFIALVPVPLSYEPQLAWQEAHLRLAELRVARGEPELATPLLETLLGCWSEADTDFALAGRARRLLEVARAG